MTEKQEARRSSGDFILKLGSVDVRWLQLILLILMIVPLLRPLGLPQLIKPTDQLFYDRIESLRGKSTNAPVPAADSWPGGYNRPVVLWSTDIYFMPYGSYKMGMKTWFEQLMRSNARVVVFAYSDTMGGECEQVFRRVIREEVNWNLPWMKDKKYGVDWIELGWIPGEAGGANWAKVATDIQTAVSVDLVERKPISAFPAFANIHGIDNFDLEVHMTPGMGAAPTLYWATFGGRSRQKDVMIAAGADQEAWSRSWYLSGQVYTYLAGIPSFASLELLMGLPGEAVKSQETISTTGVYWVILIAIGNIAYLYARSKGRAAEAAMKRY